MTAIGQYTIVDLNDITVSSVAPSPAVEGQLWLNSTTKELKMYSNGSWVDATKYTDDTAVKNLQIGGRNLLKTNDMGFTGITCTKTKYNKYEIYNNKSQYGGLTIPYSFFEAGQEYVLSFKFKVDSGTVTKIGGHSSAYTTIEWYLDNVLIPTPYSSPVNIDTSITIHNVIVYFRVIPESTGTTDLYIQLNRTLTEEFNATVYDVKIEKGNKVTDFTPAPEDVEEKIKNKITTWFYSGVPTLVNEPADNWNTSEERDEHIGDLYYNRATGYCYRFQKDGTVYSWVHITDSDIIEALAIANAASDTADSKRRIFTSQPSPPYDNGDLWVNNEEIYICQISKGEGETYEELDFIIATKYTDDTMAIEVQDNLEVLRGTVLKVKESTDEYKIQFDTSIKTIQNGTKEITEALETMSYSFGTKDLVIANSNDPVNARINNQGLKVYSFNTLKQITNHNGVGAQDLIVVGESQIGNLRFTKAVDSNGKGCTEIHHLISNIQTLEDLEV